MNSNMLKENITAILVVFFCYLQRYNDLQPIKLIY